MQAGIFLLKARRPDLFDEEGNLNAGESGEDALATLLRLLDDIAEREIEPPKGKDG